jgi:hypothetical protein
MNPDTIFLTNVRTPAGQSAARLLIASLRAFGGALRDCPCWVFATDPQREPCRDLVGPQVEVFPLPVPAALRRYPFGDKVLACARAEELAPAEVKALVWLDLQCLVVQPPMLFALGDEFDVALRPVHIRNVGLPAEAPLDPFWTGIYAALGLSDVPLTVESFVDHQRLRAYFNSHGLSARPTLGLFRQWHELFCQLVGDAAFQAAACADQLHQIFLFQALFSALVASTVAPERLRILPPSYNYPYNLHAQVPADRRPAALNDLVCLTFEGRTVQPDVVTDIAIHEPLRSWLAAHLETT